jgi:cyanophycinase
MVMSSKIPNFRISRSAPTEGFSLLADIRVIPHFNKFFKWIPDSAAKVLLNTPGDSVLIGIDELTALVRRSGVHDWEVVGKSKVHILKGLPTQQLSSSERVFIG